MDLKAKNGEFSISVPANKLDDRSLELAEADLSAERIARGTKVSPVVGRAAVVSTGNVRNNIEHILPVAYESYKSTVGYLNESRGNNSVKLESKRSFNDSVMDLASGATLDYMSEVNEHSKGKTIFVPKSAPNELMSAEEVIGLAKRNGKALRRPFQSWPGRAAFLGQFTGAELSGASPESGRFTNHLLAPSQLTPELRGTVDYHRDALKMISAEHPGVLIMSPAVGQSVAGWMIHADSGRVLPPANYETTFDINVSVTPRPVEPLKDGEVLPDYARVFAPRSVVSGDVSSVGNSFTGNDCRGRAWVGQNLNLAA